MSEATGFIIQIAATIITVILGFWTVHEKLRDRIDEVRTAAIKSQTSTAQLKGSIDTLGQKVDSFTELCCAHRNALGQRINKLERESE